MSAREEFGLIPGGCPNEGPPIVTVVTAGLSVGQTVTQATVAVGVQEAAWTLIVRNERRTGRARNDRIAMIAIMTSADLNLIARAAVPPDGGTLVGSKRFIAFLLAQSSRTVGGHLLREAEGRVEEDQ